MAVLRQVEERRRRRRNWGPARDVVWTSTLHARQPQQRVRAMGAGGLFVLSGFPDGTSRASVSRKCIGVPRPLLVPGREAGTPPEPENWGGPSGAGTTRAGRGAWVPMSAAHGYRSPQEGDWPGEAGSLL